MISERTGTNTFPMILPEHCNFESEQLLKAAENSLALVTSQEHMELQSYIDSCKQEYFKHSPLDQGISNPVRVAEWARSFYYVHVRDFLVEKSLRSNKLAHRFEDDRFVALLSPATLSDDAKKQEAFQTVKRLKSGDLAKVDKARAQ